MHVFALFGILAILVTRIMIPPEAPVDPPVRDAAEVSIEQRERMKADSALPPIAPSGEQPVVSVPPQGTR